MKKQNVNDNVAKMRILRWIRGKTREDRLRYEDIRDKLGVEPIEDKMR